MGKVYWLVIIIVAAVGIAVFLWNSREAPAPSGAWSPPPSSPLQSNGQPFRGPTGAPFIVGPKEPPPGAPR
ncbi:MAG: hypothetical protein HYW65_04300 [Candidatus Liptonbacteria bacterium]|nr:hypothetical protein [Candidatus Liptonbacteria bacterium]MBI3114543.1 hypothetical protein [Candidatus Harrisonbacteria bacterium]